MHHIMDGYRKVYVKLHTFLTLAQVADRWLASNSSQRTSTIKAAPMSQYMLNRNLIELPTQYRQVVPKRDGAALQVPKATSKCTTAI